MPVPLAVCYVCMRSLPLLAGTLISRPPLWSDQKLGDPMMLKRLDSCRHIQPNKLWLTEGYHSQPLRSPTQEASTIPRTTSKAAMFCSLRWIVERHNKPLNSGETRAYKSSGSKRTTFPWLEHGAMWVSDLSSPIVSVMDAWAASENRNRNRCRWTSCLLHDRVTAIRQSWLLDHITIWTWRPTPMLSTSCRVDCFSHKQFMCDLDQLQ